MYLLGIIGFILMIPLSYLIATLFMKKKFIITILLITILILIMQFSIDMFYSNLVIDKIL